MTTRREVLQGIVALAGVSILPEIKSEMLSSPDIDDNALDDS
jgi:hypothetical protein